MRAFLIGMLVALALSACNTTTYRSYDSPVDESTPVFRDVRYDVADNFYRDPPNCAVVLAAPEDTPTELADMVERAADRHLREKLLRVISPAERQRVVRDLVLDLNNNQDRTRFARMRNCHHILRIHQAKADDTYAVVWSERQVTIELALHTARDSAVIWRAEHTASRGDGGLAMSPLGLGGAALRAGLSHGDSEITPSLVDDAMRRLFVTLPDLR